MDDKKWIKKGYLSMCTVIFPYVLWQYFTTSCLILFITKFFFCLFYFIHFFLLLFYHKLFFCVYHLLRKYHLKAKKGYVPLERSLNVSCTKKKMFHYFIFCRLSIVFVVQEEKFFASAVIRWGWHTVAGFVWIPFDPRTRKWNT